MVKIAICDDDVEICSLIENILIKYAALNALRIEAHIFYSGETLLKRLKDGDKFDLIYLDIEMKGINGVEAGLQIRKVMKDYTTEIVYISGKDGYDRQLFDVHPLHFISKPIKETLVIEDLLIAMVRREKHSGNFHYKKGQNSYIIPACDIIYFEGQDRKIKIVTTKGEDSFYGNLEDIERDVAEYRFILIHRSYLINYQHVAIRRYSEVVMSSGAILPISRSKQKELRNLHIYEE